MNGIWDFLFSPAGIAAYAAFWALKLIFGAAVLRGAVRLWRRFHPPRA